MTTAPTPSELLTLRAGATQQIRLREKFGPEGLDLKLDPAIVIRLLDRIAGLEARKPLPPTDMTPVQHVNALVGDGLTAQKVEAICEREPYDVTGVVLSLPDGRACIVNQAAVRWFHGPRDFWGLMHGDPAPLIASREVVADGPVRVTRLHLTEEGRAGLTSKAAGPLPGITGGSS